MGKMKENKREHLKIVYLCSLLLSLRISDCDEVTDFELSLQLAFLIRLLS